MIDSGHGSVQSPLISLVSVGLMASRRLRERRPWVFPTLLVALSAVGVSGPPITALICLAAPVLGAPVDQFGARMRRVRLDPAAPGSVFVQASPLSIAVFLGASVLPS